MILLKEKSIAKMIKAIMTDAVKTTTPLACNSFQVGQDTLCDNSSTDSSIYVLIFDILFFLARVERLELPANGFGDHYSTN